ncbi:GroES-like protein [Xylariaceae sp. FL0255]|nr:GroES-like protein [Xylariaceae sp. FL0255]
MRNMIVYYEDGTLKTRTEESAIPSPGPHEILIRVEVAGCNVKDYKHPLPNMYNNALNQGDDCAGTIAGLGSEVMAFRKGERVAGFHMMDTPFGTYADYAICPEHTVFRIPESMSFEEAATIPLAAFTAAVGLYRNLQLPTPWDRSDEHCPRSRTALIINGASSAVGGFALKLAKMNPLIGPLVVTAGSSIDYVKSLSPDAVIDYRSPTVVEDLRQALGDAPARHVFDATNSLTSIRYLTSVMEPQSRYTCTSKLYADPRLGVDDSMEKALQAIGAWYEITFVGDVHGQPFLGQSRYPVKSGGLLFGSIMSRVFEEKLAEGSITEHPYTIIRNGLSGVLDALEALKEGTRKGNTKFVARLGDTPSTP